MIKYDFKWLHYAECFFNETANPNNIDILEYRYRSYKLSNSLWRYSFTHLIDLQLTEEQLFSQFSETVRYEIRRARDRDGIKVAINSSPKEEDVRAFINYYSDFAKKKGLGELNENSLIQLNRLKLLVLTSALNSNNEILTFHSYFADKNSSRALLLHSVSVYLVGASNKIRNCIGGANRYLHFADMLYFKNIGIYSYDFGGYYIGTTDKDLLDINKFKGMFGGALSVFYSGEKACSLKGHLYIFLREIRDQCFKRQKILKRRQRKRDGDNQVKILKDTK
jgi:lipid II:glycine glycyltransferase (peptidoglycan interpeptide bridge formation enzyme)